MNRETRPAEFANMLLRRFVSCDRGATAVEYSLIAGMMAVALVVLLAGVTDGMTQLPFGEIGDALRDGLAPND